MNSCELVTFVSAIGCSMSNCYTEEELELLAVIFIQLGYTLETILANNARTERCKETRHHKHQEDCWEKRQEEYC